MALGAYNAGIISDDQFLGLLNYPAQQKRMAAARRKCSEAAVVMQPRCKPLKKVGLIFLASAPAVSLKKTTPSFDSLWIGESMTTSCFTVCIQRDIDPPLKTGTRGSWRATKRGIYEGYVVPAVATTDELENMELGIKSELFDNTLRLNASIYSTEITDLQVARFDPSNVAFLVFLENVGDAETRGLDVDFMWAVTGRLTLSGAASILDTELTRINDQLQGVSVPKGSELPLAPSFSGNIRARYDFDIMNGNAWVNAALVYRGETVTGIVGSAEFMTDTHNLAYGNDPGVSIQNEGGTFGTVATSNGNIPFQLALCQ